MGETSIKDNLDIKHFNRTSQIAVVVMALVMFIATLVWILPSIGNNDLKIMFIAPLSIEEAPCNDADPADDLDSSPWRRCYTIESSVVSASEYHSVSVVRLVKIAALIVAFLIPLFNYGRSSKNTSVRELSNFSSLSRTEQVFIVIRNVSISIALTLFLWTIFAALEVMGGLAAIDDEPMGVPSGIAILTAAVFVAIITFFLIEWTIDLNLVTIGGAGIVILVVSYSLSIPFASHDWSEAFSALGNTNTSTMIAGFNGSRGLFLYAMVGLGLIFWGYTIDAFRLFNKNAEHLPIDNKWLVLMGILGFLAGVGSMIVGFVASNDKNWLHVLGAVGTPLVSLGLIGLLAWMYPREPAHGYPSRKRAICLIAIGVVLAIFAAGILHALSYLLSMDIISILELEFVYFLFFLAFTQIYSLYLTEYIDEITGPHDGDDHRELRIYPQNFIKSLQKQRD